MVTFSQPVPRFPSILSEDLKRFSEAARDPNPIHLDEAAAKASGLKGIIAHGMYVAAKSVSIVMTLLNNEAKLAEDQIIVTGVKSRFKGMVFLGDQLQVEILKWELGENPEIEYRVKNQNSEAVLIGSLKLRIIDPAQ